MQSVTYGEGLPAWLGFGTLGLFLTLMFGSMLVFAIVWFRFINKGEIANKKILAEGEPAQAQILSAGGTGARLGGNPEFAISLQVQRHGHPPYPV